jgi:ADP-ribose pyrophosphatase
MPLFLRPPRIKPWTRVSTETVGRYRVFDVQKAEMLAPDGRPGPHPFYTFTCPAWCNVLAITTENQAVLIWQYRHGTDALSLEIPGGVLEPDEAPEVGARRELLEETGYAAEHLEPLVTVYANPALQPNAQHSFLARNARVVSSTQFDEAEECELVLVPVSDLPALLDEGHVSHALCVVAIERFLRRRG